MFTLVRAIVKRNKPRAYWEIVDISNMTLKDIYYQFRDVYFVLTSNFHTGEVSLHLSEVAATYKLSISNLKTQQWLDSLGNLTLPVTTFIPGTDFVYATYRDAWRAGYNIEPVSRTIHPDVYVDDFDKCDLRLTKEGVDYQRLFNECLITVNGLFHRTNFVTDAVHVVDGGISGRYSNENMIGIYHLGRLGKLTTIPIKEENIVRGIPNKPLKEKTFITIDTEEDLTNKSVLLCISGYLHFPGKQVYRSGINQYCIDFLNYPLFHRYYEAKKVIDMRTVEQHLSESSVNENQIALEELYSDEALKALLTLTQSFFVVIDTPDIFYKLSLVEHDGITGRYIHNEEPKYPMVSSLGKIYEYWVKEEDGKYVLGVNGGLEPNYQFDTTNWKEFISVDSSRETNNADSFAKMFFLKIGKQE